MSARKIAIDNAIRELKAKGAGGVEGANGAEGTEGTEGTEGAIRIVLLLDNVVTAEVLEFVRNYITNETIFAKKIMSSEIEQSTESDEILSFHEQVFHADMDECIDKVDTAYTCLKFKDAVNVGFFNLIDSRNRYKKACEHLNKSPSIQLMRRYVNVFAQLNEPLFAQCHSNDHLPFVLDLDDRKLLLYKMNYLEKIEYNIINKYKTKYIIFELTIVISSVPAWYVFASEFLLRLDETMSLHNAINALSHAMQSNYNFSRFVKEAINIAPKIFNQSHQILCPFDEFELLTMYIPLLEKSLNLNKIDIVYEIPNKCMPGNPYVIAKKI